MRLFRMGKSFQPLVLIQKGQTADSMSKHDYNYQLLLLIFAVILGIVGIAALGALMMFMFAFM